jgi:hypothetical protein
MASITPKNGRVNFVADYDPHTYWELNSTNLGTNFGDDTSGNDNNTAVGSGDISTQESYEGLDTNSNPPASGWMDIYIITDAAMLLYIPAGLSHGQTYGLFHNGGGTHAQAGFLRATTTGVEICCTHNKSGTPQDNVIHEIPDADLGGWFAVSFQFCSSGGSQGDMALWINGVKERSGTRLNQLTYGSGNPQLGDSNADHPLESACLDPSDYSGGNWGAEATINGSGILIANFTCDNPNQDNTSPDGNGDAWHEDYYAEHVALAQDADVDESITLSDQTDALLTALTSVSESFTLSDQTDALLTALAAISESFTLSDQTDALLTALAAVSESITLSDEIDVPYVADSLAIQTQDGDDILTEDGDAIRRQEDEVADEFGIQTQDGDDITTQDDDTIQYQYEDQITADVDESITLADQFAVLAGFVTGVNESITLIDALDLDLSTTVLESITLSDQVSSLLAALTSVAESITLSDQTDVLAGFITLVNESITLSDQTDAVLALSADVAESITLSDQLNTVLAALTGIAESITLSDQTDLEAAYLTSVDESVTLSDQVDALAAYLTGIDESITLSDAFNVDLSTTILDSFTLSDQVDTLITRLAEVSESITLSDQIDTLLAALTGVDESITLSDQVDAILAAFTSINESITLLDDTSGGLASSADVDESISLSDQIDVLLALLTGIDESVTISDDLAFALGTTVAEVISLADQTDAILGLLVSVSESVTLADDMVAEGPPGVVHVYSTLSFSDGVDAFGGLGEYVLLTQDGDSILDQEEDEIEIQTRDFRPIRTQDGDEILTQDGDEILTQDELTRITLYDTLVVADQTDTLVARVLGISDGMEIGSVLELVAVTDDAIVDESLSFSDELVAYVIKYPLKTEDEVPIQDEDGFFIEVQYEDDILAPFDALSFIDWFTLTLQQHAVIHETVPFSTVVVAELGEPEAIVYTDVLTFYDWITSQFTIDIDESFTLTDEVYYGFWLDISDYIAFLDYASTADYHQWSKDQFVFSDTADARWSEYTGSVFWFNELYTLTQIFKSILDDSLLFVDSVSVPVSTLTTSDTLVVSDSMTWTQREYTGSVFWFNEQYNLVSTLLDEIEETLEFIDEATGIGQYQVLLSNQNPATEEDAYTPWTEENGTQLTEEHGLVDIKFITKFGFNPFPVDIDEELRFVDALYTQEYPMPLPNPTGPCTTEVTGDCAAPKTLGTLANLVADVTTDGELYFITVSWTAQAVAEYVRVFYRKQGTEEKYSTILADIVDGTVSTPADLDGGSAYDVLIRHETATKYSEWRVFEVDIPALDDTINLTGVVAVLANRVNSRTDSLSFVDAIDATVT